jgi:DNA-binding MarR family transcriptional regulator
MKYPKTQKLKEICHEIENNCMGAHVRRAARFLAVYYDDYLRPSGLKGTQFTLLNEIYLHPSIAVGQLAERLGVDRTTLNRNLNLLERKDLVRSRAGEDLRLRSLTLTPKGKQSLKSALPLWKMAQSEVECLFGRHLQRLLGDLRKLENLKR